jgi:hypothetical protein
VRSDDLAAEGDGLREVWLPSGVFISKPFEARQDRQLRTLAETGVWDEERGFAISTIVARTEKPWRLFFEQEQRRSRLSQPASLPASRAVLLEAVTEAQGFSRRHRMGFVGWFEKSLTLLRSRNPVALYHPDMLPSVGYSLNARQVIAAATQAWVFGPWGWGDSLRGGASVETEFQRIDAKLRTSVWGALIAAANSFDRSRS